MQFLVLEEQQRRRTAKWKEEATKGKEDKRYTLTIKASKARSSRRYRRDGDCSEERAGGAAGLHLRDAAGKGRLGDLMAGLQAEAAVGQLEIGD